LDDPKGSNANCRGQDGPATQSTAVSHQQNGLKHAQQH